jgi:hypothetical protein
MGLRSFMGELDIRAMMPAAAPDHQLGRRKRELPLCYQSSTRASAFPMHAGSARGPRQISRPLVSAQEYS